MTGLALPEKVALPLPYRYPCHGCHAILDWRCATKGAPLAGAGTRSYWYRYLCGRVPKHHASTSPSSQLPVATDLPCSMSQPVCSVQCAQFPCNRYPRQVVKPASAPAPLTEAPSHARRHALASRHGAVKTCHYALTLTVQTHGSFLPICRAQEVCLRRIFICPRCRVAHTSVHNYRR